MPQPHIPEKLPLITLDWVRFIPLISEANRELSRYAGMLDAIPNPEVFLAPLSLQEAVFSSRIEGTLETLEDVMRYEADAATPTEKLAGIQEIINYRTAMEHAVNEMQSRPLNLNLLKHMHTVLMDSVRGKDKGRGEFRRSQVYIGAKGKSIETASYVPPAPEHLMDALDNWEKYIHFDEKDRLVQLGIIHAQFEIIHPFLDGNGRIGRILIPLFLYEKGLLTKPVFYISAYLEAHRDEYIDCLNRITSAGDWEGWINFFLRAVSGQAQSNVSKARKMLDLYERMKRRVSDTTRSQYAIQALDALFRQPIFTSSSFVGALDAPRQSGFNILNKLKDAGVIMLREIGSGNRPDVFTFAELIEIIQEDI